MDCAYLTSYHSCQLRSSYVTTSQGTFIETSFCMETNRNLQSRIAFKECKPTRNYFLQKIPTEFDTSTFHALGQPISKLPTPPYSQHCSYQTLSNMHRRFAKLLLVTKQRVISANPCKRRTQRGRRKHAMLPL